MKWLNIELVVEFVKRDFIERFAGSVLGSLWSFIWPFANVLIYVIIFSNVMGSRISGIDNKFSYSIYLIAALLPWSAFATTLSRSTTVFSDKKSLITKLNITLPLMPFYINISETITLFISILCYYVFLLIIGHGFSVYHIMLPFIFLVQQLFAYALGLILAVLTIFLRDLKEVVGITLQLWFWFTPIVYVKDILPDEVEKLIIFNPAYIFSDSYQHIFLRNSLPDIGNLMIITSVTFLLLGTAYFIYSRLESDVKDFL